MKYKYYSGSFDRPSNFVFKLNCNLHVDIIKKNYIYEKCYKSKDLAETCGKKWLNDTLQSLYKKYFYLDMDTYDEFYEKYILKNILHHNEFNPISGGFTVAKLDNNFYIEYGNYINEYNILSPINNVPYCRDLIYVYNIGGNEVSSKAFVKYNYYPYNDYDKYDKSGKLYNIGDFVTVSDDNNKEIFIVTSVIDRDYVDKNKSITPYWENVATIGRVIDDIFHIDDGFHMEKYIKKYNGDVPQELKIMSDIISGRINVSEDLFNKIDLCTIKTSTIFELLSHGVDLSTYK